MANNDRPRRRGGDYHRGDRGDNHQSEHLEAGDRYAWFLELFIFYFYAVLSSFQCNEVQ